MKHSLVLDLLEHEPAIVPAPRALRVADYHPLRLIKTFRAERIAFGEPAKLAEEVVRIDIVRPSVGQSGDTGRAGTCQRFLDATKFNERIDAMSLERLDKLGFVYRKRRLVSPGLDSLRVENRLMISARSRSLHARVGRCQTSAD